MRTDYAGPGGWDLILDDVNATRVLERLAAAGVRQAGRETLVVLSIEAASPRWGAELTEEVIPLEAGLRARAISETKGCYTGQEVIIRILHRGHVNRLLRGILLGDNAPPAAGTELVRPGETKAVARITSSCASPRYGETIGLGYVRREIEPPAELLLAGSDNRVRVVALPFDAAAQGEPAAGLLHATDGEPRN